MVPSRRSQCMEHNRVMARLKTEWGCSQGRGRFDACTIEPVAPMMKKALTESSVSDTSIDTKY